MKNINLRLNLITVIIYVIGIILILQLFNLQILRGDSYREQSNTRLTRESKVEAARGNILDKTGNILASSSMGFSLELYKSKIETDELNNNILNIIKVLEANGDKYVDSFPIDINPFKFNLENDEKIAKWKKDNNISNEASAEQCFYIFKDRYRIKNEDIVETRKIMTIRYAINQTGYSSTKSMKISSSISRNSAIIFSEQSELYPGINIVVEPIRRYTSENLASHILGYIGKINDEEYKNKKDRYDSNDYIGKTGIEYVFEDYLKGTDGIKQIDMSVEGTVTDEYITQEAVSGSDVVLTIDANLQRVAENALANNIKKINSGGFSKRYATNSGAIVVMNVKSGEILAMASYPDYNPNLFVGGISTQNWKSYDTADKPLLNKAIQSAYAPGSTFKMVTAIAALESGATTRTEKINDTGVYYAAHKPVCWLWTEYHRGHGRLNVSDAIKHSCNYFFYEMGNRMGIDTLAKYASYFGLGKKTGVELTGEASGTLASRAVKGEGQEWYLGETLSAAIGQSYNNFTPLQMCQYISMLANGGKRINTTIVKSVIKADGSEIPKAEIDEYVNNKLGLNIENTEDLNINSDNLKAVLEGMRSVTTETGGTAYNVFKDFNIEVGGKTGSAEAGSKVNAWFAGFAPFNNPEIAVVVMVENGGHGNYTAEVVREIISQYFGMNGNQIVENVTAIPYTETNR